MDVPVTSQDVLTKKEGLAGRLRLNRPKALHSLNRQMVRDMAHALIEWRDDPDVRIILIDHAEGRGFCAGGDVVGISVHTANALRGYKVGKLARARGAYVVFGGIHATLYPQEAHELGGAHSVVKGDGDVVWSIVLSDCLAGNPRPIYEGGRIEASDFMPARWDLIPRKSYMWASVQTVRGCPKHCSFCSVWRTDGQRPRQRSSDAVIEEIVQLRRLGFRFIALADDNFYPVTKDDLAAWRKARRPRGACEPRASRDGRRPTIRSSRGRVRICSRWSLSSC